MAPTKAIDHFLSTLVAEGGSDLHISPGIAPRIRIDGRLHTLSTDPLDGNAVQLLLQEIMSQSLLKEWQLSGTTSADFAYDGGALGRFRVNAFLERKGPALVARSIPGRIPTAEELDLPDAIRRFAYQRSGLVLITGAAGEGKSTTLASLIDLINRDRSAHVITIEDPIEFTHASNRSIITQREIGPHTPSFPAALKDALREDPDVIVVGEIRTAETMQLILEAAETGHLVFGTMHTISAVKSVNRAIGMVETGRQSQIRSQLAEVLRGVIAQRLVPRIDQGRAAAFEILINTPGVASTILEGNTTEMANAMESDEHGMQSLEHALAMLTVMGQITLDQARAHANSTGDLMSMLRRFGFASADSRPAPTYP
jgi:twitching motility protein PilT